MAFKGFATAIIALDYTGFAVDHTMTFQEAPQVAVGDRLRLMKSEYTNGIRPLRPKALDRP